MLLCNAKRKHLTIKTCDKTFLNNIVRFKKLKTIKSYEKLKPTTFHGRRDRLNESHFKILRKGQGKFDCLVFEMLYIKKFKPNLNVQSDSIRAKLFV